MKKLWRKIVSVILALAMVFFGLPEYVSPVNTAKADASEPRTVYMRTDVMTAGHKYLIVASSGNSDTTVTSNALTHSGTTAGVDSVVIHPASADPEASDAFIEVDDVDAASIWTAVASEERTELKNGDYYLTVVGRNNTLTITENPYENYSNYNWTYKESGNPYLVLTYLSGTNKRTRYITYTGTTFKGSDSGGNIYVYEETTLCKHNYVLDGELDWEYGENSATAVATYECSKCHKLSTVEAEMRQDEVLATCTEAPKWLYTATITAAMSPNGQGYTETKTKVQRVVNLENTTYTTVYVLVNSITAGKNYLIVNTDQKGAAHAVANGYPNTGSMTGSGNYAVKDRAVEIKTGEILISGAEAEAMHTYIEAPAADAVWAVASGYQFGNVSGNTTYYLQHYNARSGFTYYGYAYVSASGENQYKNWTVASNYIRYASSRYYYLVYNSANGNPWESLSVTNNANSIPGNVYFFEEAQHITYGYKDAKPLGHQLPLTHFDAHQATCLEEGNSEYWKCGRCGEFFSDENGTTTVTEGSWVVGALGHDFGEWVTTTEPSCTEAGVETRYCSRCDAFETQPVEALGHDYVPEVTEPTCTEGGYTTHTCSRCGDSYTADETEALGHAWGDWVVTTEPKCGVAGEETRTCSRCGETETRPVDALEHDYVPEVTEPTCTEGGYTTYTCSLCGDSYTDDETEALGHDFGEWEVTTEPGCEEAGEETRTCDRCGETETRPVDALGHDYVAVVTDPTCTEPGYTTHTCSVCGNSYTDTPVDALGHEWTFVDFTWTLTDTGYAATANYVCKNDETHEDTVEATVEQNYDAAGAKLVYTATVAEGDSLDGADHSDTKELSTNGVKLSSANVEFKGLIRMRMAFAVPEELLNSDGIYVVYYSESEDGLEEVTRIAIKDGTKITGKSGVSYGYYCPIRTKQYADTMHIRILDANGEPMA